MDVYKNLPRTNCGECGVATCLAFAMKLVQKQTALDACPHVTDAMRAALEGSAAPPMATIAVGKGDGALKIGGETVLFRHEETFRNPCGLALRVSAALSDEEILKQVAAIEAARYDRVGMRLGADLIAVEDAGEGRLATAARLASQGSNLPLVLVSTDPAALAATLEVCGDQRPLLCGATSDNLPTLVELAKKYDCPLALRAADLPELVRMSQEATEAGCTQLVLDSGAAGLGALLNDQTAIRRAALTKKFKPLGFPTLARCRQTDPARQMMEAATAVAKYAGIVVLDRLADEYLLPLVTARLNLFSDPQKPIQVEAGLHAVGEPTPESPVLVTTNFSLTYYLVEGDIMAAKTPAYILAVDTKGASVLTAWAAGDFTGEAIAAAVEKFGVADQVSHRNLILPGGVAVLKGKLEEASGWKVIVGPRESSGITAFFRQQGFVPQ
jgi:acetyl-CoA decarbonylase/synthase complex subunit gamma